jgi:hypothetical protein
MQAVVDRTGQTVAVSCRKAFANISRAEIEILKNNAETIAFQMEHLKSIGPRIRENNVVWEKQKACGLLEWTERLPVWCACWSA